MLSGRNGHPESWDAVIVGAGPAGMFAALSLAHAGIERVLLIDAGQDVDKRTRPVAGGAASSARRELERGVGGAGLFSDGKLCMSLDVGGHLETSVDDSTRASLLAYIEAVFSRLLQTPRRTHRHRSDTAAAAAAAARAGLAFKYYPVTHIGTDRCTDVIIGLRRLLEASGVTIRARTTLTHLELDDDTSMKLVHVDCLAGPERLITDNVILAMGKTGAAQQAEVCAGLGIELTSQPLYVGVRFEDSADVIAPLFALTKDPKYSLRFDDGSKVKTHCASENGEVIALRYAGLPLAGGHNYSDARTSRSGFSLLWDGMNTGVNSYSTALDIMRRVSARTGGELLVHRMSDYLRGEASTSRTLDGIALSHPEGVAGDVRDVLPDGYFPRMDEFVRRLTCLAPELMSDGAVMYAPAIEWWMQRVAVVDEHMRTRAPGVFACGDGSGWSQGIVHAAATGALAAAGIRGQKAKRTTGREPATFGLGSGPWDRAAHASGHSSS